jgi:hypothetical protein
MTAARAAKVVIIGAALVLMAGCSTLRLGYNNAPQLSWWWLDGYFDFNSAQSKPVRQGLDTFFDWHRRTQLPQLADFLAATGSAILEPTTAEVSCGWFERGRALLNPTIDRAVLQWADIVPTLDDSNFKHLEQHHAKQMQEMRDEYLQADPAERRAASLKRSVNRAEQIYGNLEEAQLRVIRQALGDSAFDPGAWLTERERRQADTLQTLRRLVAERASKDQRVVALNALVNRTQSSGSAEGRADQRRRTQNNCELAAQIHNATTPAQRAKAQSRLKGWESDVRALIGQQATPP